MRIVAQYSFNTGLEKVLEHYPYLSDEIKIKNINAQVVKF